MMPESGEKIRCPVCGNPRLAGEPCLLCASGAPGFGVEGPIEEEDPREGRPRFLTAPMAPIVIVLALVAALLLSTGIVRAVVDSRKETKRTTYEQSLTKTTSETAAVSTALRPLLSGQQGFDHPALMEIRSSARRLLKSVETGVAEAPAEAKQADILLKRGLRSYESAGEAALALTRSVTHAQRSELAQSALRSLGEAETLCSDARAALAKSLKRPPT